MKFDFDFFSFFNTIVCGREKMLMNLYNLNLHLKDEVSEVAFFTNSLFIFLNGIPSLGPRAGVIFIRPLSGDRNKESLLTLHYKLNK
jgi:hypothetical protein